MPSTAAPAPAPSYAVDNPLAANKTLALAAWAFTGPRLMAAYAKKRAEVYAGKKKGKEEKKHKAAEAPLVRQCRAYD